VDVRLHLVEVMDRAGGSSDTASTTNAAAAVARESELDYAGFSRFELELEVCFWSILLACLSVAPSITSLRLGAVLSSSTNTM